jgi:hypothetical protein
LLLLLNGNNKNTFKVQNHALSTWHIHSHWRFIAEDGKYRCLQCENYFQKGDLISIGTRVIELAINETRTVDGEDLVHWNCSGIWSRRKDCKNVASSFVELVSKIIGGYDGLKQIQDWNKLDIDVQIKVLKHAKIEIDQTLLDAQKYALKKRKREIMEECGIEDLESRSFRDLQSFAKRLNIKANQKKTDLINSLRAALTSLDD